MNVLTRKIGKRRVCVGGGDSVAPILELDTPLSISVKFETIDDKQLHITCNWKRYVKYETIDDKQLHITCN